MSNQVEILDKLDRNLKQRAMPAERVGESVELTKTGGDKLIVTYTAAQIQSPMGGVDDSATPFLGIGTGNPGSITITADAAAETSIALMFDTVEALHLLTACAKFANDIVIVDGGATELARLPGHAHLLGLGS